MRAKALAERAVAESGVPHTIFAPSIVYAPGDVFLTLLERMALLPVVPISGSGRALFQPIWARRRRRLRHGGARAPRRRASATSCRARRR